MASLLIIEPDSTSRLHVTSEQWHTLETSCHAVSVSSTQPCGMDANENMVVVATDAPAAQHVHIVSVSIIRDFPIQSFTLHLTF